jgi:hypothetical protein
VTDPCIGWDDSVALLEVLADAVRQRRAAVNGRNGGRNGARNED